MKIRFTSFTPMLVNGAVIYPILTILLMKLSFKIAENYNKKQKKKKLWQQLRKKNIQ